MTRTIPDELRSGLAGQRGSVICRVLTWTTQADYLAGPTSPVKTWRCLEYDIYSLSAKAVIASENDYTFTDFNVFIVERGLEIDGVEYTVQSGMYFVRTFREDFGKITVEGSSFPEIKITLDGRQSYSDVIDDFCAAIGKTAEQDIANIATYFFLQAGKQIILNRAALMENLLLQKHTILMFEKSPGLLRFYELSSYDSPDNGIAQLAWAPGLTLFTGDGEWTSENGLGWTYNGSPMTGNVQDIVWSPELALFAASSRSGSTSFIYTSVDGLNWTQRYTQGTFASIWEFAWSPELGLFVTVNPSTPSVMTSPDGVTWTTETAISKEWSGVAWCNSLRLFIAVAEGGSGNRAMTSPDGRNWTGSAIPSDTYTGIAWSPSLGIAVAASYTKAARTSDGTTWATSTITGATFIFDIVWAEGLGLFVATGTGSHRVYTSPDGITWTGQTAAAEANWTSIAWAEELGLLVAAASGVDNFIMTSPDGIEWTLRATQNDSTLTYQDGPKSYTTRGVDEIHFAWINDSGTVQIAGDPAKPRWNLGYMPNSAPAPAVYVDPYYKFYLQMSPIRLDITDGDKIHFVPYWQIDPTKVIDAMVTISEHFKPKSSPAWYQEVRSIALFNRTEGA